MLKATLLPGCGTMQSRLQSLWRTLYAQRRAPRELTLPLSEG